MCKSLSNSLCFLSLLACLFLATGCQPDPTSNSTDDTQPAASESEGHVHSHDDVGPHGGHLLHLEPSGIHAEWGHDDDSHTITVYLDDFDAEKVESAKFMVKVGEDTEEYPLESGESGWTIQNEALMNHINMGDAATVQFIVTDDSGEHQTKIEAHEHHHH